MSRFAKLFAANAIAATGLFSAAVALSSSAAAEPAIPPAVPGIPGLNMIQQFATNPASMGAVLQTAATALNGASQMVGAPAPATLPVSPIEGAPGTAPLTPLTPLTPAAPAAPAAPTLTDPAAALAPLLGQLGFPANLVNLGPADMPFPIQIAGSAPTAPTAPVAPVAAPLVPALPPVAPAGAAISPLPLLDALP
ncbi:MAG: hypothetical protein O3A42_17730 [Actinobacteria bacterium]|nr:hypothetical protein [Actinomycetota bacterium]